MSLSIEDRVLEKDELCKSIFKWHIWQKK